MTRPLIVFPPTLAPLMSQKRWVIWRWETTSTGKKTKVPYQGRQPRRHADTTDPNTWCDLKAAMLAYTEARCDGIGFVLTDSNVCAADLDHCRDPESGALIPWAADVVARAGTYCEVTPSQEGVRIIGTTATGGILHTGGMPVPGSNGATCELYRRPEGRYITMTGAQIGGAGALANIDALLDGIHAELAPQEPGNQEPRAPRGRRPHPWGDLNERTLANLDKWVPKLFPSARRTKKGGYRIASADLGRGYQEDLSLVPSGCKYFGIADQGDKRKGRRTPLELVMEWEHLETLEAARKLEGWLKEEPEPDPDPDPGIPDPAEDKPESPEKPKPEPAPLDDNKEIELLARLGPIEYERARKDAGKRLGISRLSLLDALVKAKRAELGLDGDDDGMQGHAIEFPTPEPWPERVDGAALLDEIATAVRSHVVLDDHARDATALWVVHTYIIKLFSISPKLFIRSAARGCGKSTLLDVLAHLVVRPMLAANITTATVFRIIEKFRPTLLIDEVDSFLKDNEELRGVLNASHRYDGVVPRLVGEDHEPRNFSVYTAIALAGIGGLHATLLDRSVVVDLQRRKLSEPVASLRIGKTAHLDVLVRKILRWVADNDARIGAAEPAMPPGVINRLADNWHTLLAIADTAGGKWPERARAALLRQQGFSKEAEAQSLLELLLADIYEIFTAKGVEQISSTLLAELLADREDRPWAEYGRNEKPITPAKVSYLLRPLHITAERIRIEQIQDDGRMAEVQVRGYRREQFAEVFDRFSSGEKGEGDAEVSQRRKRDEMGASRDSKVSQDNSVVTPRKSQKSSNGGLCAAVTLLQGGTQDEAPICAYCGRPGGQPWDFGDQTIHLHRQCEEPYVDGKTREQGVPNQNRSR